MLRAGVPYCLPRWFLAVTKRMTDQLRRALGGEGLNVAHFLRLTYSLAGNHCPSVKEITGNGEPGRSSPPSLRKTKPLNSLAYVGEYAGFGRLGNPVQSRLLSLCSLLSQEQDICQAREKMCCCGAG